MKLVLDNDEKYKELLLKHLRAHNESFTGKKKFEEKYIYVVEKDELLGAMKVNISWDWVTVNSAFYKDVSVLESLLFEVNNIYGKEASGIAVYLRTKGRINDYETLGFKSVGKTKGTKKVLDFYTYNNLKNNYKKNHDALSGAGIDQYNLKLEKEVKDFMQKYSLKKYGETFSYHAVDGENYLGGVIGMFKEDQVYVDLLAVNKEYRKKGIGVKLMTALEEYAKKNGAINIHLGTAEFQAKGFYEKLGYSVTVTMENYPKGYECYTMQKFL